MRPYPTARPEFPCSKRGPLNYHRPPHLPYSSRRVPLTHAVGFRPQGEREDLGLDIGVQGLDEVRDLGGVVEPQTLCDLPVREEQDRRAAPGRSGVTERPRRFQEVEGRRQRLKVSSRVRVGDWERISQ